MQFGVFIGIMLRKLQLHVNNRVIADNYEEVTIVRTHEKGKSSVSPKRNDTICYVFQGI